MKAKKLKIIKIIIWALMLVCIIFNSLTTDYVTGVIPHIISGVILFLLTVVHIFLSRKYFLACTKSLFSKKLKAKARFNCLVDFILIGLLIAITVMGIVISPDSLAGQVDEELESIHGILAAFFVIIIIVHGCLHIKGRKKKQKIATTNETDDAA